MYWRLVDSKGNVLTEHPAPPNVRITAKVVEIRFDRKGDLEITMECEEYNG